MTRSLRQSRGVGKTSTYAPMRRCAGWRKYVEGARYLLTKGGYLALGSSIAAAFVRSGPEVDYADIEISFRPMTFFYAGSSEAVVDNFPAISASVYRVRPASRGEIV